MKELFIEPLPKLSDEDISRAFKARELDLINILAKRMEQIEDRISKIIDFINDRERGFVRKS